MSERKLLRILTAGFGVAVIVGAVIGVGILRIPGVVAGHLANAPLILGMWMAGGVYHYEGSADSTNSSAPG